MSGMINICPRWSHLDDTLALCVNLVFLIILLMYLKPPFEALMFMKLCFRLCSAFSRRVRCKRVSRTRLTCNKHSKNHVKSRVVRRGGRWGGEEGMTGLTSVEELFKNTQERD